MILTRPLRKPWWWLMTFLKKERKVIFAVAVVSIVIFGLGRNILRLLPQFKLKTRIGIVGQYTLNTLPPPISQRLGRGLFKANENGEVVPDLARSWEVSDEGTGYKVFLSPNEYWNDGTPIVSSDLEFTFKDVEVSYPDDYQIEFKLNQPFSPFLSLLTTPLFKNKSVGAGQYSIIKTEYQGQYLKRLNLVDQGSELIFVFYPSQSAAWLGFRLGETDKLENLILNPVADRWSNKVNVESEINRQSYLAILFNLQNDKLSSKPLRQALAYAIKSKSPDPSNRALSPISPNSWAYNPDVKPYNYQPSQAKDLFDSFEEQSSPSGELEITLGTSSSFLQLAEEIAASWQEVLPIKVNVKIVNSIEPDFQAILIAQEIPLDPDQHVLWHSTQANNITHYSDLRIDKLLEDGRQISDEKQRKEIYQDFQRFIVEDSPAIFLSHPITYTISRK
jgi:peptide/nickel transport system substrate-binding protein